MFPAIIYAKPIPATSTSQHIQKLNTPLHVLNAAIKYIHNIIPHIDYANKIHANSNTLYHLVRASLQNGSLTHTYTVIQIPLCGGQVWWQMEQWWVWKSLNGDEGHRRAKFILWNGPRPEIKNIEIKYIPNWILSLTGLLTQDSTRYSRQSIRGKH